MELATADCAAIEERIMAHMDIPDHVSIDAKSPHFWDCYYLLGVKIDGRERLGDVHEFCVSEGWAMVRARGLDGKPYDDGTGHFAMEKITGRIEPYLKKPLPGQKTLADAERINAAEAKRQRKAAKLRQQFGGGHA
jgi:hypothetical protein